MKLKLIEPLKDLFKDEVRKIGRDLGMLTKSCNGNRSRPGLAVRVLGEVTPTAWPCCASATTSSHRNQRSWPLHKNMAVVRCAAARDVGGRDGRHAYLRLHLRHPRCQPRRRHTADWFPLPHDVLKIISTRIVNEVKGVNRVVYDITSKPRDD